MSKIIREEFAYHQLNAQGADECNRIRAAFSELLTSVESIVPASRERSLVLTKLQEACRWSVTAAARKPDNQEKL